MCVLAIWAGTCFFDRPAGDDWIERQARETAFWLQISQAHKREIKGLKAQLAAADGTIAKLETREPAKRAPVMKDLATIQRDTTHTPVLESFNVVPGDTVQLTRVRRRDVDAHDYVVPLFMFDAWKNAVDWAVFMDTLVVQYKERDGKAGLLIAALDQQLVTDSSIIASQKAEIGWWQRKHHAHCGRKCGMVIGASGVLVGVFVLDYVRSTLSRDHKAVYPLPYRRRAP